MGVSQDKMFGVPEDVWLLIFGINMLPNFHPVFWRTINSWNSILTNLYSNPQIWQLLLQDLRRYLTRKEVLVFRMVCRGWKSAMDTTIENLWAKPEFLWDTALPPFLSMPDCPQKSVLAIQALTSDMTAFPMMKKSLAGRSISLRMTRETEEDVIIEYFRAFGDSISDLKIFVQDNSLERVREKLYKYILQTPNLRRLEMVADVRSDVDADLLFTHFIQLVRSEEGRRDDQPKFLSLKYLKIKSFFLNTGNDIHERLLAISFPLYCRLFHNIWNQINIIQLEGDFYNISPPKDCLQMELALRFPTDHHLASLTPFLKATPGKVVLIFPDPMVNCQKLFRRMTRSDKFTEAVSGLGLIFDGVIRRDILSSLWSSSLSGFKQLKELVIENGLLTRDPVQIRELPSLNYFVYRFNQEPEPRAEIVAAIEESTRSIHSYMQDFRAVVHMGTETYWIMEKLFFTHKLFF